MNIVIAGGRSKADFLIGSLLEKGHHLVVINEDEEYCRYLSKTHAIPAFHGDPSKIYTLEDANVKGYDIIIALKVFDSDNLAICQAAKRILGIKRAVAIVANPKNVEVFKQLGVNTAISATYLLAGIIEQMSTINALMRSVSVEHNSVVLTELLLDQSCTACGKKIAQLSMPQKAIIGCVLRGTDMMVPHGDFLLLSNDKLIILSDPAEQKNVIASITGRRI